MEYGTQSEYEPQPEYQILPEHPIPPEYQIPSIRHHFSKLGLMFFLGTLLIFAVQLGVSFLAVRLPFIQISTMDASLFVSTIPMYLIGMPLMALLIKRVPSAPVEKHKMTVLQWIAAFFMCYAIMYLSNLIGVALTLIIGTVKGAPVENALVDIVSDISPWTAAFIMVLCAPIAEELIFRKLLIDRTVKYGENVSVLFSGLFFGLFHGNLNQFAYAFMLGVFFGFIYVKTGKLIYTIGMHMAVNFLGSVAGMLVLEHAAYDELMNMSEDPALLMQVVSEHLPGLLLLGLYGLFILGAVIAGIILLAVNIRKMKLCPSPLSIPKGKLLCTALFNVGVILFILFWVIQIVLQLLE